MTFLENNRILLRAVEPEDAEELWHIETDSRQWRDNGMMAPYSRHNLKEYAENYDADPIRTGQLRLVIEEKTNGKIAGITDLYDISAMARTAFLGIYVNEESRENHIAAEALALLESYCRQLLNLRILGAKVGEKNHASIRLFTKAGFEKAGELREWLLSGRETSSLIIFTKSLSKE